MSEEGEEWSVVEEEKVEVTEGEKEASVTRGLLVPPPNAEIDDKNDSLSVRVGSPAAASLAALPAAAAAAARAATEREPKRAEKRAVYAERRERGGRCCGGSASPSLRNAGWERRYASAAAFMWSVRRDC